MKNFITAVVVAVLASANVFAQDTITFLSGRTVTGRIKSASEEGISISNKFLFMNFNRQFFKDELYSMNIENHVTVFYKPDLTSDNSLTDFQMRSYIKGFQDGRKNYHAPMTTVGGFVSGITGGIFGFWGLAIPSVYVFVSGIKTPEVDINHEHNYVSAVSANNTNSYGLKSYKTGLFEETTPVIDLNYFETGYQTAAKDKKIKNAIKGGILGFAMFVAASYVIVTR